MSQSESKKTISESDERANKIKALDITIDSLKQYITLSTFSIAGLLAFYNGNGKDGVKWCFIAAVIMFILCAIISIATINTFITKVNDDEIDVRQTDVRVLNFIAIFFFLFGIVFGAGFFFSSNDTTPEKHEESAKIIINREAIEIGKDVKTKVSINIDSLNKSKSIIINP